MGRKGMERKVFIERVSDIYMQEGLHISMNELSKRLQISKRTIYEQFEDKTNLIRTCILHELSQIPSYVETAQEEVVTNLYNRIKKQASAMFGKRARFVLKVQEKYPELYREVCVPFLEKIKKQIIAVLEEGEKCGYIRLGFNTELLYTCLTKQLSLVLADNDNVETQYSLNEIFKHSLHPLLRGILTPKGVQTLERIENDE